MCWLGKYARSNFGSVLGTLSFVALCLFGSSVQAQDEPKQSTKPKTVTTSTFEVIPDEPSAVSGTVADPKSAGSPQGGATGANDKQQQRQEKFAQYMTGASLKGRFTILGMADKMPEEIYTISKCEKLAEGNLYRFTARIQYGDTDTELPMDIPVEWAGDTPVISLTNMWIPGLGTFSARVLIYKDTYAGTWIHDDVGGQMFGVIVKDEGKAVKENPKAEGAEKPAGAPQPLRVTPDPVE